MPLHDFILPKPDTNSTVFDFLVIFCSFYVYSLVPGVWHQCLPLCIGQVSFSDIATCSSLPSSGITHLQRYYGTIRLPIFLLSLFLLLTRHTLLLFFSKAEKIQVLSSWRTILVLHEQILPAPRSCVKSHLNDKPTCCLPLRPQSRHSDLWYFGAQLLSLQPCCLRLAHYITVTHSRLASNAVVSSLFDRISTCRIARPLLDARSGT